MNRDNTLCIQPYPANRFYRQYKGQPVLLLGGSEEDNLFQFTCEPATELLSNRSRNEAYCTANPGADYAVFFPDGGDVLLDVSSAEGKPLTVQWLDIRKCRWTRPLQTIQVDAGNVVRLVTPEEEGYWAAVIKAGTA